MKRQRGETPSNASTLSMAELPAGVGRPIVNRDDVRQEDIVADRADHSAALVQVFFYGSYMDPVLRASLGATAMHSLHARLDGYRLLLDPLARIVPDPGSCVLGVLTSVVSEELETLYATPAMRQYRQTPVAVSTDTGVSHALTYTTSDPAAGGDDPIAYRQRLAAIAERAGLPVWYRRQFDPDAGS